jgi:hypothetical protein
MQICKEVDKKVTEVFEETIETVFEKVDKFCEDLPWPFDWVCHAIVTIIRIVEVVVKTIVRVYVQTVCYLVAGTISLLAWAFQYLLLIPIIGPFLKWFVGGLVWLWSQFVGWVDAAGGLAGLRPIKHLRLEVFILQRPDGTWTTQQPAMAPMLANTESIFRSRADIKVHTTIHYPDSAAPSGALTIGTEIDPGIGMIMEDATEAGMYFQSLIASRLGEDSPWFVLKVGAPLVVFVVDQVEGSFNGCSGGVFLDYICVEGRSMATVSTLVAHEMGHALALQHDALPNPAGGDASNLMYYQDPVAPGVARGNNLSPFQRSIARSSPHVTYV